MDKCKHCGFNDEDMGCTCPSLDKWYACDYESEKPENRKMLEEMADWYYGRTHERIYTKDNSTQRE